MLITNTNTLIKTVPFRPNLGFVKVKRSNTYITDETLPLSILLINSSNAEFLFLLKIYIKIMEIACANGFPFIDITLETEKNTRKKEISFQ